MIVLIGILIAAILQPHIKPASATTLYSVTANCNCTGVVNPVCGSNLITYPNVCVLNCASQDNQNQGKPPVTVASYGNCPTYACSCYYIEDPLCASDKETYKNKCYLDCMNLRRKLVYLAPLTVLYRGKCILTKKCSLEIKPVCGTDRRSYRNDCFLQRASEESQRLGQDPIYVKSSGACAYDICICPENIDPVCGSDNIEYSNLCAFECQRRRREQLDQPPITYKEGRCGSCTCHHDEASVESCICPQYVDPVCGSDNKTYSNSCYARCVSPPITYRKGECIICNCTKIYDPVCATDKKTYDNPCLLACENRRRALEGLPPLGSRKGVCCNCDNLPTIYMPVCGYDGKTYTSYRNLFYMNCASECSQNNGGPIISYFKNGYC